jgi:hypothetical protein
MKTLPHIAAAAATALAIAVLSPGARADESPSVGISLDGYVAPVFDDSVTNMSPGQSQDRSRGLVGLATVANVGSFAAGAVVDGFPGIFGDGRLTVGTMVGWQPQVGTHRFQVLGEIGAERFSDVGGNFFASPSTHETWLDYVGARLGTSETFGRNGHFELGAWLFVRKDLGEAAVTNTSSGFFGSEPLTTTDYVVGGYTAGAAFRVGFRFDQRVAPSDSTELAVDL